MFIIIISKACKWCSGWCVGLEPLGPGFESQVPQNIYSIFLHIFMCSTPRVIHHTPQRSTRQVASGQDPVAKVEGPPYSLVSACIANSESQQGCLRRAQTISIQTPSLGPIHLGLFFSFHYFFIYLLVLFLLFLINC